MICPNWGYLEIFLGTRKTPYYAYTTQTCNLGYIRESASRECIISACLFNLPVFLKGNICPDVRPKCSIVETLLRSQILVTTYKYDILSEKASGHVYRYSNGNTNDQGIRLGRCKGVTDQMELEDLRDVYQTPCAGSIICTKTMITY